jgi:hypothetical protein
VPQQQRGCTKGWTGCQPSLAQNLDSSTQVPNTWPAPERGESAGAYHWHEVSAESGGICDGRGAGWGGEGGGAGARGEDGTEGAGGGGGREFHSGDSCCRRRGAFCLRGCCVPPPVGPRSHAGPTAASSSRRKSAFAVTVGSRPGSLPPTRTTGRPLVRSRLPPLRQQAAAGWPAAPEQAVSPDIADHSAGVLSVPLIFNSGPSHRLECLAGIYGRRAGHPQLRPSLRAAAPNSDPPFESTHTLGQGPTVPNRPGPASAGARLREAIRPGRARPALHVV